MPRVRLADFAVILAVLIAGVAGVVFSLSGSEGGSCLVHAPDGDYRFDLSRDQAITLRGNCGPYVVEIRDKKVRVKQTSCPHRLCQLRGYVHLAGDSLACVPNGVLVKIEAGGQELDGITE